MNPPEAKKLRRANVYQQSVYAGTLEETGNGEWSFSYVDGYDGIPISLTLPVQREPYRFREFPPVFEGLLPEGIMLASLLRRRKIDQNDFFAQLLAVGADLVGSITVLPVDEPES